PRLQGAGGLVDEVGEAETVADLVGDHREEVEVAALLVVDAVVPVAAGQARGIGADARVELRDDVDEAGVEVETGERVGEGRVVPGRRLDGSREVPEDEGRSGRAEGAGGRRAAERREARGDEDVRGAV